MALIHGGLEVDDRSLKKNSWSIASRFNRLLYMALLFFSDFDATGFFLAFSTYWSYTGLGSYVVKGILVMFPLAFLFALGLNFNKVDQEENGDSCGAGTLGEKTRKLMSRPPTPMQTYHFVPIWRMQLYLSSPTKADIEAMFRINTLSSFSLGVAQLVGMTFYLVIGGNDLTLPIYLNMVSQACNWTITIMYYMTPVSICMMDEVSTSIFERVVQDNRNSEKVAFLGAAERCAADTGGKIASDKIVLGERADDFKEDYDDEAGNREMAKYRRKLEIELNLFEDLALDLSGMPGKDLEELRRRIFKKNMAIFRSF